MKRIFISYSHKDEALRHELDKHLIMLKRQNLVDVWTDHCIRPGEALDAAISDGLEASSVILLLVSVDFLASDYCYSVELERALQKQLNGEAAVVPVILRPCEWHHSPLGKLKAIPADGKPVVKWQTLDDAFLDVVKSLRRMLSENANDAKPIPPQKTSAPAARPIRPIDTPAEAYKAPRSSNLSLPKVFTDEERYTFIYDAFGYIQNYFEASLKELSARNRGITTHMNPESARGFSVTIFREGKRKAGCFIRVTALHQSPGIAYSNNEQAIENSYNEMLTAADDRYALHLQPMMGIFSRDVNHKLTEEGAAEHLWSMLISALPDD